MRLPRPVAFHGSPVTSGPSTRRAAPAPAGRGVEPAACSDFQRQTLQAEVERWCRDNLSCNGVNNCNTLIESGDTFSRCVEARRNINNICFDGGDAGHREAQRRAEAARNNCLTRFAGRCQDHPEYQIVVDWLRLNNIN